MTGREHGLGRRSLGSMDTAPALPDPGAIGGYRLVRTLGAGPRATVHLGHAEGHPHAAVKVFAAAVPPERIEREAEALMRAAGEHVVRLDDLALDDRGRPAFLLERVPGPSLGALLDRRRAIRPGEAVTILAPVAATVARLHRSGVVHGGLDPASVLFTEAGSPTLVGFGDAELLDLMATGRVPVAERSELLARDRAALRRLAVTVLDRTAHESAEELAAAEAIRNVPDGDAYAERLAETVFGLAEPEPVDLDATTPPSLLPSRLAEPPGAGTAAGESPLLLDALQVPEWLRSMLGGWLPAARDRLRSLVGSVRRPFWVAGGVAAAALTATLLFVPADRPAPDATGAPEPADGGPSSAPHPEPAEDALLRGDDPAAAARELLDRRADCFRELSVLCLDGVDQADSSASLADAAAILAAQERGGIDADGVVIDGETHVVERLGGTALIRITSPDAEPASVLVIRTEAGWRIRGFPGAARAAEQD
jgi:eukaryotic-like serine/threonine-protein kinase